MTVSAKFRMGGMGERITLNFQQDGATVNVAASTTRQAYLTPPSGTVKIRSCAAGPANYQTYFDTNSDFDEVGTWRIHGYAEGATFIYWSEPIDIQVEAIPT